MKSYGDLNSLSHFLLSCKSEFLDKWIKAIELNIPPFFRDRLNFEKNDFSKLFDTYTTYIIENKSSDFSGLVLKLIKNKISADFPLSIIGFINSYFMSTAREIFRLRFPDAFDTRMEYLEKLAQCVQDNEVYLANYFEEHVHNLNMKLKEQAHLQKERNKNIIEFIDLATHQLQAPLWSILGFVSKLERRYWDILKEDGKHCITRITANVSEMHQLIEDMVQMLILDSTQLIKKRLLLNDIIIDCVRDVRKEVDPDFECTSDIKDIYIKGDPYYLRRMFYQLLKNAAQYTKEDVSGKVRITNAFNDSFHLMLEDKGIGIDKEYFNLVFKPMERLKEKEVSGSGLGLTFVERIVKSHGGSIVLNEGSDGGLCVQLTFPLDMIEQGRVEGS